MKDLKLCSNFHLYGFANYQGKKDQLSTVLTNPMISFGWVSGFWLWTASPFSSGCLVTLLRKRQCLGVYRGSMAIPLMRRLDQSTNLCVQSKRLHSGLHLICNPLFSFKAMRTKKLLEFSFLSSTYMLDVKKRSLAGRTVSCSQGKKQKNDIPFFPEDIFFHILIWLPAEFLHYCGRYVCKAWAKIIRDPSFIKAHLLQSKGGLFIQKFGKPYHARFLQLKEGDFKVTPLNCYFPGQMVSSCGGMSLFCGSHPQRYLYVGNLVTMQYENLPFPIAANELFPATHISFVPHTGEYKVVCHCVNLGGIHRFLLLTVGNNMSWRLLDTPLKLSNLDYVERTSVTVGGVLYWAQRNSGMYAIDLLDETSYSIQVPNEIVDRAYWLLELGNSVSCVANQQADVLVCVLKDLYRSEWAKLYIIREAIDRQKFLCQTFIPICWMDDGQNLVFIIRKFRDWKEKFIVAYNLKTEVTRIFDDFNSQLIQRHTNSLASW